MHICSSCSGPLQEDAAEHTLMQVGQVGMWKNGLLSLSPSLSFVSLFPYRRKSAPSFGPTGTPSGRHRACHR